MAFCDKCGAYIPDGQTECLACGYDEAEKERIEQEQAAAAAAAEREEEKDTGKYYSFSNEELREKLEEQRRKQQEASRKWAEQEKQRRQKAAGSKPQMGRAGKRTPPEGGRSAKLYCTGWGNFPQQCRESEKSGGFLCKKQQAPCGAFISERAFCSSFYIQQR